MRSLYNILCLFESYFEEQTEGTPSGGHSISQNGSRKWSDWAFSQVCRMGEEEQTKTEMEEFRNFKNSLDLVH